MDDMVLESDLSSSTDIGKDLSTTGLKKYCAVSPFSVTFSTEKNMTRVFATRKKRNGEERLPTRRPEVYNRNAILARENRLKKKLYLESLERELQEARIANKALTKALKRQLSINRNLEKQKHYFQNLACNRAEISNSTSHQQSMQPSDPQSINYGAAKEMSNNIFEAGNGSVAKHSATDFTDFSSFDFYNTSNFLIDFDDCDSFTSSTWASSWDKTCLSTDETFSPNDNFKIHNDGCYLSSSDIQSSPEFSATSLDFCWDDDIGTVTAKHGSSLPSNCGKDYLDEFAPISNFNVTSQCPPTQLLSDELLP